MPDLFKNSSGEELALSRVVAEIIAYMHADDRKPYKIIVGSDSLLGVNMNADFVTAIVVHRVGNGGRYFWCRQELEGFHTLRDRIIREVLLSLEAAQNVLDALKEADAPQFDFEIHADIGENGPTKTMIQEVVGMIRAHNFEARVKPRSFAASNVADRHV